MAKGNKAIKITSCPFCGCDEVPVFVTVEKFNGDHETRAHCAECDASGPLIQIGENATDEIREALALASWNERHAVKTATWVG